MPTHRQEGSRASLWFFRTLASSSPLQLFTFPELSLQVNGTKLFVLVFHYCEPADFTQPSDFDDGEKKKNHPKQVTATIND